MQSRCLSRAGSRAPARHRLAADLVRTAPLGALLAILQAGSAQATTYTVCASGCDYATIQAAIDARMGAGNTIVVKAGTYRPATTLAIANRSGSPSAYAILRAEGPVVIDGADDFSSPQLWTPIAAPTGVYSAFRAAADMLPPDTQVFVDDVRYAYVADTLYAGLSPGQWAYDRAAQRLYVNADKRNPGGRATFVGNRNRSDGIRVTDSHYVILHGFTVLRSRGFGINATGSTTNLLRSVVVESCTVAQSWNQGINYRWTTGGRITGSTSHDNAHYGIYLLSSDHCDISHNEVYRSTNPRVPGGRRAGIKVGDTTLLSDVTDVTVDCNSAHDNSDSGIDLHGASRVVVRRNVSYRNGDHGYDNNATDQTAFINDVACRNDHDGISMESTSSSVSVYNCVLLHDALNASTLANPGNVRELAVLGPTGFASNHNVLRGLPPGPLPGGRRHLVEFPGGIGYDDLASYRAATGQDSASYSFVPAFADTAAGDFEITSGSDRVLDAATTDLPGWLSTRWLATDPHGCVAHDTDEPDAGAGSMTYADIGAYEYDPAPGAPEIGVACGRFDFVVSWIARGDDGDTGTAGTREVFVNGAPTGPAPALPPGTPTCVHFEMSDCTPVEVAVRVRERDNGQSVWSNTVNTMTRCTRSKSLLCDTPGIVAPGSAAPVLRAPLDEPGGDAASERVLSVRLAAPNPARSLAGAVCAIPPALAGQAYDLSMFDVSGRRVAQLGSGTAQPGHMTVLPPVGLGRSGALAPGVYFLRLTVGTQRVSRTVFLVP